MQRTFGTITCEWDSDDQSLFAPDEDFPFEDWWFTVADWRYKQNGNVILEGKQGDRFDGSSIPPLIQWLFFLRPAVVGRHPPHAHDFVCKRPKQYSREFGDAMYLELAWHSGAAKWKVCFCTLGIRLYSWWKRFNA